MDRLFSDIQFVKGVGPKKSKALHKLNIKTVFDILWYMPRDYFNRSNVEKIVEINNYDNVNIKGFVKNTSSTRTSRGLSIFKAMITDNSGSINAIWFNQAHLSKKIKSGDELFLSGKIKHTYGGKELFVNEYEIISDSDMENKILPIYSLTEGIYQNFLRKIILQVLNNELKNYIDIFDENTKNKYKLCDIQYAFKNIHYPESREAYIKARRRLAFEELFLYQVGIHSLNKKAKVENNYVVHNEKTNLVSKVLNELPFNLTNGQKKVLDQIFLDMESPKAMNRLLQGDVGSGKTVVAALALTKAVASGYQTAIMAPTEILAEQHYKSISMFLSSDVVVALLTGSTPNNEKKMILEALDKGDIDVLIGTHALIQNNVNFKNLGLVIIDEQHRFGVKQRGALTKKGQTLDVLIMTATPIPRTLALTVYGDLEVSIIDELPPGRKPIKTIYIKREFRNRAYNFLKEQLKKGSQAYVVCPLVEESELQELKAVTTLYEELKEKFSEYKIGLIHGRMPSKEKELFMNQFKNGSFKILVATTVIEVGVDIPNASIMLIEHAERFGLSQLHQLRGRVGRGSKQSFCILIGDPKNDEALKRLKTMEKTSNGFVLAQEDLSLRGPGDFLGVRQHGLNDLKVANLISDTKIIEITRKLVKENLQTYQNSEIILKIIKHKFKFYGDIVKN
ncbi:ATP-dependent DNA helicase RecG [Candidatus Syntrophocurvum alkaliphilum]|uniref:ATP-dependent DNA helicase RecG n=1 Tax=Candidatus Syntrophocurvum alkaliphilum TaxID=2293317 RepID=A0A6I6D7K6_9FIRM|nr:ATP-dependent DNA helicase RecG [Candidatus Syntrophocurvum alkaliphilum]QGT99073.1 ATP-dependent DNA helicase RecG [Candidatus Syntrophocurvum alkaliphilum]